MKSYLPCRLTEPFKLALTTASLLVGAGSATQAQTIISYTGSPLTVTGLSDNIVFSFTTGQAIIEPSTTKPSSVETPQFRLGYVPGQFGGTDKPILAGYAEQPEEFHGSVLNSGSFTMKLNAGDSIDSTSGVYTGNSSTYLWKAVGGGEGSWAPGTTGYAGIQFIDSVTTQTNYGWVLITYGLDKSVTLVNFAYDTTGASILTGAIPEPSSWALILAGGALSAAACRKRRKARALAAAEIG